MVNKRKSKGSGDGPQYRTYVVGATVAVVGLARGIVSFFISKPEPATSVQTQTTPSINVSGDGSVGVGEMNGGEINVGTPAPAPSSAPSESTKAGTKPVNQVVFKFACVLLWALLPEGGLLAADRKANGVTVTGDRSVGIGTMSGRTINMLGLNREETRALVSATGQELVSQLTAIVERLNAKQAQSAGSDKFSLGVVQTFLTMLKGQKIQQSQWSEVFGELTREYLRLGEQIGATPNASKPAKNLAERADAARKLGDFERADTLLSAAIEVATSEAQPIQEQVRESTRQAASLVASRARLALVRLRRREGAALFEKAFALRRNDVTGVTLSWLFEAGDAWRTTPKSAEALQSYETAMRAAKSKTITDSFNTEWQRILSLSHTRIGEMQVRQEDFRGAVKSYRAGLDIRKRLADSNSDNTEWQWDLYVSHAKIGYAQSRQPASVRALKSYRVALGIVEPLATKDPYNTQLQRELSVSHTKVGDMQYKTWDTRDALENYRASLEINEHWAGSDSSNTEWQRALSLSHGNIGNVQMRQGDTSDALKSYQAGLKIDERLAATDPDNIKLHKDMVASYWKISSVDSVPRTERQRLLSKGLDILRMLESKGRLPADIDGWIEKLERKLAKLSDVDYGVRLASIILADFRLKV